MFNSKLGKTSFIARDSESLFYVTYEFAMTIWLLDSSNLRMWFKNLKVFRTLLFVRYHSVRKTNSYSNRFKLGSVRNRNSDIWRIDMNCNISEQCIRSLRSSPTPIKVLCITFWHVFCVASCFTNLISGLVQNFVKQNYSFHTSSSHTLYIFSIIEAFTEQANLQMILQKAHYEG